MDTTGLATELQLVYPPVSNQEADWLLRDPEVEAIIRTSNLYLIGARAEATFSDFKVSQDSRSLTFLIGTTENLVDTVTIDIDLVIDPALKHRPVGLEAGEKLVRLSVSDGTDAESHLGAWFTTEKLIYDRGRGLPGIRGFTRWREFATYDLLYVGISKKADTYDRLFDGSHQARQSILTNEYPRKPGARVTDEIVLFPLRAESLGIRVFDEGIIDMDHELPNNAAVVADAEKAFASLLKPNYNVQQYERYPSGADGLYGAPLDAYTYVLRENVTFTAGDVSFRGATVWADGGDNVPVRHPDNSADIIWVRGDDAVVFHPGKTGQYGV